MCAQALPIAVTSPRGCPGAERIQRGPTHPDFTDKHARPAVAVSGLADERIEPEVLLTGEGVVWVVSYGHHRHVGLAQPIEVAELPRHPQRVGGVRGR